MSERRLQHIFKLLGHPEDYCLIQERRYGKQATESNGKLVFLSYAEAEMFQKQTQVCIACIA